MSSLFLRAAARSLLPVVCSRRSGVRRGRHRFALASCLVPLLVVPAVTLGASIAPASALVAPPAPSGEPAEPGPEFAAAMGSGVSGITPYGGFLGNYIAPDGTRVYCIDASLDWPAGATGSGIIVGALETTWGAAIDPTTLRKLNYALLVWGQTDDPVVAAAVGAYVYAYTSGYARHHGAGYEAGAHYINGNVTVLGAYNEIWSRAETEYAGRTAPTVGVTVELSWLSGTVTVDMEPHDARGELTLSGATVESTGATTVEVGDGSTVPVSAIATEEATTATVEAAVHVAVDRGAPPEVVLYATPGQQRTIRGSKPSRERVSAVDRASVTRPAAPPTSPPTAPPTLPLTGAPARADLAPLGWTAAGMLGLGVAVGLSAGRRRARRGIDAARTR